MIALFVSILHFSAMAPIAYGREYPIKLGTYRSSAGSLARIKRVDGQILLNITSRPARVRPAAAGADCELRARYVSHENMWELIPFSNETMNVRLDDISDVYFNFEIIDNSFFKINTDFASKNCAIGVIFDKNFRLFGHKNRKKMPFEADMGDKYQNINRSCDLYISKSRCDRVQVGTSINLSAAIIKVRLA